MRIHRIDFAAIPYSVFVVVVSLIVLGFGMLFVVLFQTISRYDALLAEMRAEIATLSATSAPPTTGAMWSLGTGGSDGNPYFEWLAAYDQSTLWPFQGAPSLRFFDHTPEEGRPARDFEIGFYRYGPTWYSRNSITEFWLGSGVGGILSVAGNDLGGGEIQVRNPFDTDAIRLIYRDAEHPTITTESGRPLYLGATQGLVSESRHLFAAGLDIAEISGRIGSVTQGWQAGQILINAPGLSESSLVFITPLTQPKGQWWLETDTADTSFVVHSSAPDEDMQFHWLIIGTDLASS